MKEHEVIDLFLCGMNVSGNHLYSTGDRLIHYNTCIAEWNGDTLIINNTYYSNTTSKYQNKLKKQLTGDEYVIYVENIDRGTQTLKNK